MASHAMYAGGAQRIPVIAAGTRMCTREQPRAHCPRLPMAHALNRRTTSLAPRRYTVRHIH